MKKQEKSYLSLGECFARFFISAIPFFGAYIFYEHGLVERKSDILDKLEELGMSGNLRNKLLCPELWGNPTRKELCNDFCIKSDFTKEEEADTGDSWGYEDVL